MSQMVKKLRGEKKMESTTVKITQLQGEILLGFLGDVSKYRQKHVHSVALQKIIDDTKKQMR